MDFNLAFDFCGVEFVGQDEWISDMCFAKSLGSCGIAGGTGTWTHQTWLAAGSNTFWPFQHVERWVQKSHG